MRQASVTLVGAGGLGGPIARSIASRCDLTIYDDDRVELSNLHRQTQFRDEDLGLRKAIRLAELVGALGIAQKWSPAPCDLVVDGSDSPETKFAVCDFAVRSKIPYVIASALRYGGNIFVGGPGAACYRCVFEAPPDDAPSCAAAGVLGPVVGVIGALAGALALRALASNTDAGSIWVIDDARVDSPPRVVRFARRGDCPCKESIDG